MLGSGKLGHGMARRLRLVGVGNGGARQVGRGVLRRGWLGPFRSGRVRPVQAVTVSFDVLRCGNIRE